LQVPLLPTIPPHNSQPIPYPIKLGRVKEQDNQILASKDDSMA